MAIVSASKRISAGGKKKPQTIKRSTFLLCKNSRFFISCVVALDFFKFSFIVWYLYFLLHSDQPYLFFFTWHLTTLGPVLEMGRKVFPLCLPVRKDVPCRCFLLFPGSLAWLQPSQAVFKQRALLQALACCHLSVLMAGFIINYCSHSYKCNNLGDSFSWWIRKGRGGKDPKMD